VRDQILDPLIVRQLARVEITGAVTAGEAPHGRMPTC
jgi:hypothetical protein